jgi:hypothetical protein
MSTTSTAAQAPPAGRYAIDPAGVFRTDCAVDRYAHGITMMPGLAARRLSVQMIARARA